MEEKMSDQAEPDKKDNKLWPFLDMLCQKATELGATKAVAIPVSNIVVEERVRFKCFVPRCPCYGFNLMCPPHVMSVADFRKILDGYHGAILLKINSTSSEPPEELAGPNNLTEAWDVVMFAGKKGEQLAAPARKYAHALRDNMAKLNEIIGQIESLCLREGYFFAAGLSAGGCSFCDECVGPNSGKPCRHPFKARPSMEAMGINVAATVEKAGLNINFDKDEVRRWVGLILVD